MSEKLKAIPTNKEAVKSSVLNILEEYKNHKNFSQNGVSSLMLEISNKIADTGIDMAKFGEYTKNIVIEEANKVGYKTYTLD